MRTQDWRWGNMGTVNSAKVETDELTGKSGSSIPENLKMLTPLCYGIIRSSVLYDAVNVSSLTYTSNPPAKTRALITMKEPAPNDFYTLHLGRDGDETAHNYTANFFWSGFPDQTKKQPDRFTLFAKIDNNPVDFTAVGEVSFLVFSKDR